ncbi:MAG: hypothetical protein M3O07_07335, partial [Pseudomonadota bacterium]|nr:hypothetical protein [Pseudomonadota bacterium]
MKVPWFALHFAPIPPGLACFCDRMSPAARVQLTPKAREDLHALAESSLRQFEQRSIQAPAYIAPPRSLARSVSKLPSRVASIVRVLRKGRAREFAQFVDMPGHYDVMAAIRQLWRLSRAHSALERVDALEAPPDAPYVLFGLHKQPESTIDVWAPFFSNQIWVIELLSRSIPPSHRLLVKIHKSDIAKYPKTLLDRMR